MNREARIEQEVLRTLQELDHPETTQASPYFTTRTLAKIHALESQQVYSATWRSIFRHSLRPAFLAILVALNVYSTAVIWRSSTASSDESRSEYLTAFAETYNLTPQQDYDLFSQLSR